MLWLEILGNCSKVISLKQNYVFLPGNNITQGYNMQYKNSEERNNIVNYIYIY